MASPTYAQWSAEFSRLNINPSLGMLYFNHAPIFRGLLGPGGLPSVRPAGRLKVNYTDGATAASLAATANLPSSGAPAFVDDTETKVYAAIASQAYTDHAAIAQAGDEAGLSLEAAVAACYREFVGQVISTNDGETYGQVWGAGDFVANVTQESDSMQISGSYAKTAHTDALLKRSIGNMIAKLPQDGSMHVCVTSPNGYEAVYSAIEGLGGTTPLMTPQEAFGFSNLMYRNTIFFVSDKVDQKTSTNGAQQSSDFWFFNTGREGVSVNVPDTMEILTAYGPDRVVGNFSWVTDVALNCQVLYQGHHSAGKLSEWVKS